MRSRPKITVAAIAERDGAFLFVEERIRGRIVLNQPAGHLEANESLADAVVRETLEETGWHYEPKGIVGLYRWTHPQELKTYFRICFHGDAIKHDPARQLDHGIVRALWLPRSSIDSYTAALRSPLVTRCVDDYVAGRRFPLDVFVDVT